MCKDFCIYYPFPAFQIYPYWNVNAIVTQTLVSYSHDFQIYPYWNVNTNTELLAQKQQLLSNLSILECKLLSEILDTALNLPFKSIHIGM